ncbi:MAG: hypothetical protein GF417_08320 [Candidatus Latescibacteria bacterium]|nr:hypothetical protein [bacterium]MBD3424426.1 hypothetical protein [Candidatus Latescibacterota bacterium]
MYTVLMLLLIALAVLSIVRGVRKHSAGSIYLGAALALLTFLFFKVMDLWGEALWFQSVGYISRFWKVLGTRILLSAFFGLISAFIMYLLVLSVPGEKKAGRWAAIMLGALIGLIWGATQWMEWLRFTHRISGDISDPVLGMSEGFYLFTLPFLDSLYSLILWLVIISLVLMAGIIFFRREGNELRFESADKLAGRSFHSLYIGGALLLLLMAFGKYLSRFHLLYSKWGVVHGPGWTDVHVRLPVYWIMVVITALFGLSLLVPGMRERLSPTFAGRKPFNLPAPLRHIGSHIIWVLLIWLVGLSIVPALVQWIRVEPNEITLESPYIKHNISFTRRGFNLQDVEEKEFPVSEEFTREMVESNREVFKNVRLWDYRALDAVYKQFQEIRLYYEFTDVDVDRYHLDTGYRQVMVSAREMELDNLPEKSQTFVNRRFKYTHGYGVTLTNVSEFTPQGLPHLLIKDIPPRVEDPALEIRRPEIYYGELTRTPVVVNSNTEEFDYPSGEQNRYVKYQGSGGVILGSLWRKFLFGYKFDGTRFFFSGYPGRESRLMFHRQVCDRLETIAPFLSFDNDPYIVVAGGELYWIVDGYTASSRYPYSEPFTSRIRGLGLSGINYLRNSVKAVVNAYSGEVKFYVFEPDDPLIRVYSRIFPDLFTGKEKMPEPLMKHVRYPIDMLLVQGQVYAQYHMDDPTVFYNQEDLWVRATEKYYGGVQPVEPYYIMWEPPGKDEQEFVLMMPFTPKNRQVLIGWIAGMCDEENYGRFLAYQFPKEKRVLGTQQVETKIDQDRYLSGQLTLWDQRGSNVIRGNVLVIPLEETIFYVEPIYLKAETAAYPELRLVAVMHNDNLSYAETFDKALEGLFSGKAPPLAMDEQEAAEASRADLIREARSAFDSYLKSLSEKRFDQTGESLQQLQNALDQLMKRVESPDSTRSGR